MEFSEVVKIRYSCKKFDGRKVEKEKLNQILETGRLAPLANHGSRKPLGETVKEI